jgi:hypothetical protein
MANFQKTIESTLDVVIREMVEFHLTDVAYPRYVLIEKVAAITETGGPMVALLFLLAFLAAQSNLWAQSPFYQGKTITVIAASSAGSAYDCILKDELSPCF